MPKNSPFNFIKKINAQERSEKLHREAREQFEENRKKEIQRAAYEKKLQQEKIKIKKNIYSETSVETNIAATEKRSFGNFMYHNSWWLVIFSAFVLIAAFLIYDIASKPKYDLTVLLLIQNSSLEEKIPELEAYFETVTPDLDGNGKVRVSVYSLPLANEGRPLDGQKEISVTFGLRAQLENYNNLIVIADKNIEKALAYSQLYNIESDFNSNPNVNGQKFYLKDTNLADKIGYNYFFDDDVFIGIRLSDNVDDFKKQYEVIKNIIEDLDFKSNEVFDYFGLNNAEE